MGKSHTPNVEEVPAGVNRPGKGRPGSFMEDLFERTYLGELDEYTVKP